MHQSFVVQAPMGPGNSGAFNFSVFKALLNALHCGDKFIVKSLLKAPAPAEVDNNDDKQMTWTIWINFLPLSNGGSTWNLASIGPVVSEKIFEHTHARTHARARAHQGAFGTVHVFLHTRTQQLSKNMVCVWGGGGGGLWRQSISIITRS